MRDRVALMAWSLNFPFARARLSRRNGVEYSSGQLAIAAWRDGADRMRRRDFVRRCVATGVAIAWPLALHARTETARIGFIGSELRLKQFRHGLQELSLREGRDVIIAWRPNDPTDALPRVVAELLALKVDVIVASGSLAVDAARKATRTIPIVMTGSSAPVGTGFVASPARRGRNITGLSLQSPELSGKRLQFLKDATNGLSRLAVLYNPDDPAVVFSLNGTQSAAQELGIRVDVVEVRRPEQPEEAFAAAPPPPCEAMVALPASLVTRYAGRIAEL